MSSDAQMVDNDERRAERRAVPFTNRKMRRKQAKKYKLFKDRSGQAWRIANEHMKGNPDEQA